MKRKYRFYLLAFAGAAVGVVITVEPIYVFIGVLLGVFSFIFYNFWVKHIQPPRIPKYLLLFLSIGLPIHQMFVLKFTSLFSLHPISLWKEVIALWLVAIVFFEYYRKPFHLDVIDIVIFLFINFNILNFLLSSKKLAAAVAFRNFVMPLIIFTVIRHLPIYKADIQALLQWTIWVSVPISIWGIYQAVFMGPSFIADLQFFSTLPSSLFIGGGFSFQRAIGTFVSPNNFGLYLMLILLIQIFLLQTQFRLWNQIYKICFLGILGLNIASLILTFSRSSWIGLFVGFLLIAFIKPQIVIRHLKQVVTFILIINIAFWILVRAGFLNVEAFLWKMEATWRFEDLSVTGHFQSWSESLKFLERNPLGIGLGQSGPRAELYAGSFITSESSYFIVGFDLGILGLFLYGIILLSIFLKLTASLKKSFRSRDLIKSEGLGTALAIFFGTHIAFLFLPYITEPEVISLLYMWIALFMNFKPFDHLSAKPG